MEYNGISSVPLYHPPLDAEKFYNAPAEPFIFVPSRLEELKRQHLIIKAMKHVRSPVVALLAGEGGQKPQMQKLIDDWGVSDRVRIFGPIFGDELRAYYARSLAVFFGPKDEDLGYITLEAMLSGKPVVTCRDSGGPLEFVVDKETGYVVDPEPEEIAEAIDTLYADRSRASEMGRAGRQRFADLQISWDNVLQHLLN
jgi:glycosyltransferase involved in cell wall biosynthesis